MELRLLVTFEKVATLLSFTRTTLKGDAPDSTTKMPGVPESTMARVSSRAPRFSRDLSLVMALTLRAARPPGPHACGASCRWAQRRHR
jgi:hypothetical protein